MADWQQIVALALVALAVAYLLRSLRGRGSADSPGTCGSCRKCDEAIDQSPAVEPPRVDVETLACSEKRPHYTSGISKM
jgi:hypothetical protein